MNKLIENVVLLLHNTEDAQGSGAKVSRTAVTNYPDHNDQRALAKRQCELKVQRLNISEGIIEHANGRCTNISSWALLSKFNAVYRINFSPSNEGLVVCSKLKLQIQ